MDLNRRSFFRLLGRASGTAAAVVVGGAAVLPALNSAKSKWMGPLELPYGVDGLEALGRNAARTLNQIERNQIRWAECRAKIAEPLRTLAKTDAENISRAFRRII